MQIYRRRSSIITFPSKEFLTRRTKFTSFSMIIIKKENIVINSVFEILMILFKLYFRSVVFL